MTNCGPDIENYINEQLMWRVWVWGVCVSLERWSQVAQAGLNSLFCQGWWLSTNPSVRPPKFWDYRHEAPCPVHVVLGIKSRASCIRGKHSTNPASPGDVHHSEQCSDESSYSSAQVMNHPFSNPFTLYMLPVHWSFRISLCYQICAAVLQCLCLSGPKAQKHWCDNFVTAKL